MKKILIIAFLLALVACTGYWFVGSKNQSAPVIVTSSGIFYRTGNMIKTNPSLPVTWGKVNATSSVSTSQAMAASDLNGYSVIDFTPNVTGITLTLPATSTLSSSALGTLAFVPNTGDWTEVLIRNSTTTASASFTLAAGTGMNMRKATSTLSILPGGVSVLKFVRKSNTDIDVFYNAGI